jgi:RsiW-degrading membrane proteinase PrsW (M82 family)
VELLSTLAAAVAPGVALLAYFYLSDRYDAEPLPMVIKMFFIGALIVVPIMIVQRALSLWFGESDLLFSFATSAGVEEFFKWFVLYHIVFHHAHFDEPYDGIVYATAVSLGFATVENILYALFEPATIGMLLMRALLPVSGHALFGVFMGFLLGKARFASGKLVRLYLWLALLVPLFWHGLYDYLTLTAFSSSWVWLAVPFMFFLWMGGIRFVHRAHATSPFRFLKREEEVNS